MDTQAYKGSSVWKRMLKQRHIAEQNIKWIVGSGKIDAYKDIWLELVPRQSHASTQVKEFFSPSGPKEVYIKHRLGDDAWHEIQIKQIHDWPQVWSKHLGSIKQWKIYHMVCMEFCEEKGKKIIFDKYVWDKHIPARISVFLWRLMHNYLPTDSAIKKRTIQLASKCVWCRNYQKFECTHHLFLYSEVAQHIWSKIHILMKIQHSEGNFSSFFLRWWTKSEASDIYDWLKIVLPGIVLWFIWKARNKGIFDEEEMKSEDIMLNIKRFINSLFILHKN